MKRLITMITSTTTHPYRLVWMQVRSCACISRRRVGSWCMRWRHQRQAVHMVSCQSADSRWVSILLRLCRLIGVFLCVYGSSVSGRWVGVCGAFLWCTFWTVWRNVPRHTRVLTALVPITVSVCIHKPGYILSAVLCTIFGMPRTYFLDASSRRVAGMTYQFLHTSGMAVVTYKGLNY